MSERGEILDNIIRLSQEMGMYDMKDDNEFKSIDPSYNKGGPVPQLKMRIWIPNNECLLQKKAAHWQCARTDYEHLKVITNHVVIPGNGN